MINNSIIPFWIHEIIKRDILIIMKLFINYNRIINHYRVAQKIDFKSNQLVNEKADKHYN